MGAFDLLIIEIAYDYCNMLSLYWCIITKNDPIPIYTYQCIVTPL